MNVRRQEINVKALNCVPHQHRFFHPVRAAALETGRGSGSPPGPPHSHTDSERESRSWSLDTWRKQTYKRPALSSLFKRTTLLTGAGAVRRQRVTVQTVALVASVAVHAAVLTGTRLQSTLVQICKPVEPSKYRADSPTLTDPLTPNAYPDCMSFLCTLGSTCICWGRHTLRACSRAHTQLVKKLKWKNTSSKKHFEDVGFLIKPHVAECRHVGFKSLCWIKTAGDSLPMGSVSLHLFIHKATLNLIFTKSHLTLTLSFTIFLPAIATLQSPAIATHPHLISSEDLSIVSLQNKQGQTGVGFSCRQLANRQK